MNLADRKRLIGPLLVVALVAFALLGGLTYLVTSQFLDLAR
jgi:hypothetical protein